MTEPANTIESESALVATLAKKLRHLPSALLASLVMLLLGHLGWLDWLERSSVELASTVSAAMPQVAGHGQDADARSAPRVVTIGEAEYQRVFHERSPLPRDLLLQVVERVLAQEPSLLAVDIDLSPMMGATPGEAAAQQNLDSALIAAARRVPVVLVTPQASTLPARSAQDQAWMARLCAAPGIHFAYPYIARNQGVVLRMHPGFPSLGIVAHAIAHGVKAPDLCAMVREAPAGQTAAFLDPLFLGALLAPLRQARAQVPLNLNYYEKGLATRLNDLSQALRDRALSGSVVFLGGDYDGRDRMLTAAGTFSGVQIHAGMYYSLANPIHALPHGVLLVGEALAGWLMLLAFGRLWTRHFDLAEVAARRPLGGYVVGSLHAMVPVVLLAILVAAIFLVMVLASGFLLAQATWFNFGPIVVAAVLKARMTGTQESIKRQYGGATRRRDAGEESIAGETVRHTMDFMLLALFVLVVVALAVI